MSHAPLFIFFLLFITSHCVNGHRGVKCEMFRGGRGGAPVEQLRRLVDRDTVRARAISRKVGLKEGFSRRQVQETRDEPSLGELPIYSGADYGTGEYLVKLRVGSPPQEVVLIADTGSDLTWSKCSRGEVQGGRVFHADRSSSFRTFPCSSAICKTDLAELSSLSRCPSMLHPCAYDYSYSDGSATLGVFANETVTFSLANGKEARLNDVLVGCSKSVRGQSFQAADGVMGLGYSNPSLAVKAAGRFGGKFSYCLVDSLSPRNVSSFLIFGSHGDASNISVAEMQYTRLVLGVINPFYAVSVRGISAGGVMLEIPAEIWDLNRGGGVIVDSGTSLTVLAQPAYKAVMDALQRSLQGFKRLDLDIEPLEYCFNSTGFDAARVPGLVLHFADGASFEAPVKSYVIDAAPEVKCLGIAAAAWPGVSIVGNIMQQNHLWEFDIGKSRLGFAASSCV